MEERKGNGGIRMNSNEKKPTKKPLIFYYLIVLVVLMLLNWLVVPSVMERSIQKTSYREKRN